MPKAVCKDGPWAGRKIKITASRGYHLPRRFVLAWDEVNQAYRSTEDWDGWPMWVPVAQPI